MSNELSIPDTKALAAQFDAMFALPDQIEDLTAGASGGFTVLGFKGSRWHIKAGGEDTLVTNADGDPRMSLPVVLLKANKNLSKVFYASNYSEGDDGAPDCFSNDGVSPDPEVAKPVAPKCQGCPNNVFGSRITENGKKAKACSDSRRVAVVPAADILNEVYGGPMLLRVPATSLVNIAGFAKQTAAQGVPYQAAIAKLGFDTSVSYPKLTCELMGVLDDAAKAKVVQALTTHAAKIDDILGKVGAAPAAPAAPAEAAPSQEASKAAPDAEAAEAKKAKADAAKADAAKADAAKADAAKAKKAKADGAKTDKPAGGFDAAVDDMMKDLEGLM